VVLGGKKEEGHTENKNKKVILRGPSRPGTFNLLCVAENICKIRFARGQREIEYAE
jgi:hypothetical protein